MDSRARELSRAHGLHMALKVKDSKTGKVILKDNVFEDSKLEDEINQIEHLQKKEANRLRWEREYMRKKLLRRRTNPEMFALPPIEGGGLLTRNSRTTRSEQKRYASMEDILSDDSSPERSPHCSVDDIRVKPRHSAASTPSLHVSHSETTTLPALLSPRLIRKDSTKDPRFRRLLQNLVPKTELTKTMSTEL